MKSYLEQGVPSIEEAKLLLLEAQKLNPGPWIDHSVNAGKAAELVARICLTHSFDCNHIRTSFGKWDYCNEEEYNFVKTYIANIEYDDYDKLIQLCDSLALPSGICLIEKRMVDVALRHGIHEHIIDKWKATFETKRYFEEKMGKSIYSVLPCVIENTF
ncbi:phosphohydrolase [Clostridium sp. CS001]|uniref:phosphohydrolase n=1 Tax=Clostridium sp. CS001 TaxID=2880648 RepID=UPI001CF4829F|nr:phosphohydrolase [Clostridium sp. CS001]MCB2291516.1 phosphohydrolase [Clostridium sp. CS001]